METKTPIRAGGDWGETGEGDRFSPAFEMQHRHLSDNLPEGARITIATASAWFGARPQLVVLGLSNTPPTHRRAGVESDGE